MKKIFISFISGIIITYLFLQLSGYLTYGGDNIKYWVNLQREVVNERVKFEDCLNQRSEVFFAGHIQMNQDENWEMFRYCKCVASNYMDTTWCKK
ncbi:MAG: hypothetical protein US68_C0007G0015 [Candidatus Shapirobacteria bacterium GW2011_GWE1_38_10]|uniref:Uncharacterized protein n=1 Tax=Candidatus Shapirobacteria bacterium GW2011_GWE1_38_10 TaxID=1618488 RepID=A0A0G0I6T6_9BACT|nr:MAG: hypothetical protein US46_C0007G0007 [Candidatus Shapirobacteria bacterium GW2011_GWF2_37_20]KKQ50252.1 MAG: hypothetical protein US68_C0007G0015 [Candidatus Shapirobacteria bacterium GW2011_GWE1_38_10]KKQ64786.1 MAG: hypothetical protein US85_C0003G0008 [Candidatus Shapirobacteria bacterium GW2011_GWF1_38_23]HBP50813.1 hypothetical protein [Candidatus Shapirobacteria bacterium]